MPRQDLPSVSARPSGIQAAYMSVSAANGAQIPNNGRRIFLINNAGGATLTLTILTGGTVNGLAIADQTIAVPAGQTFVAGPFPRDTFNQPDTGMLFIDTSAAVNLLAIDI